MGCGYGWHCKFAEEQGATKILGIDLSKKMIEEAQKRNSGNQIEYRISGLEEYDYPENEWDCVISNLALHYIEDIVEIFQKVYRTLKPGGIFLFNVKRLHVCAQNAGYLSHPSKKINYQLKACFSWLL